MAPVNVQVKLARRPGVAPVVEDFAVVESPLPSIADGEFLVRHDYLSLDPYMVGRMRDVKSYAASLNLGDVMCGHTVGEVVESKNPKYPVGAKVAGYGGWQRYAKGDPSVTTRMDPAIPETFYLSILGMPGATAWVGTNDICKPKEGETLVVTAAAGAVGSMVGQLAKARGARVVGVAGGPDKCRMMVQDFGFDACVDYKSADWVKQLKEATPKGVDCLFENVGGEIFDRILARFNPFGRIAVCGMISRYAAAEPYGVQNIVNVLTMRLTMQGFIVSEHLDRWPHAFKEMGELVKAGRMRINETIAKDLRKAPDTFLGLLSGANTGKLIVDLRD